MNISGNFTNNGTLTAGALSVISFVGSSLQTIGGSVTTTVVGSLNIASTATVDLSGKNLTSSDLNGSGNITNSNGTASTLTTGSGNSSTFSGILSGNILFNKQGNAFTLILSGANTYTGTTSLGGGTIQLSGSGTLGTTAGNTLFGNNSALDLNGVSTAEPIILSAGGGGTSNGKLINTSSTPATVSGLISFNGTTTSNNMSTITANGDIIISNTGTITTASVPLVILDGTSTGSSIASIIGTGASSLTKNGTGRWTLSGANTYTGITTINLGELRLNPVSNSAPPSTQIVLSGGKFSTTGIASGITITNAATLNVTANSSIDLGSNAHSLKFAASNGIAWNAASTLTINGWTGTGGATGTGGKIFFGTATGTLTAAQLGKITFTGFPGTPMLLSSGELVPFNSTPNCPSSTSVSPITDQAVCQGFTTNQLTATVTIAGTIGTPTLQYQWYYNTTNSNTVSGATSIAGATAATYTPLSTVAEAGTRYYFVVGYATNNGCGQTNTTQTLASGTVSVTVNPVPSQPAHLPKALQLYAREQSRIIYTVPNVAGITYSWSYSGTGATINGTGNSVTVDFDNTATGGTLSVTAIANNGCGTSAARTIGITVNISCTTCCIYHKFCKRMQGQKANLYSSQ